MEDNAWIKRWDDRYKDNAYAYGIEPNEFLKEQLDQLPPASILFPAEGEGRNAVYAAKNGWQVTAFDISEEGKKKADLLTQQNQVALDYHVGVLEDLNFAPEQFKAIAFIYAHFPAAIKSRYHKTLLDHLQPGGMVIFEAFSKNHIAYQHLNPNVGDYQDMDSLFSLEEVAADFSCCDHLLLEEVEVELNEGLFHIGKGSVIRFVGRKR